jgi:ATP-dependent Clp protease ATP-binding subunit ClpA
MYQRFTDRARKVMQLASQEAQRLHHQYIGTEHILLGLVKEGNGVAVAVLKNLGVEPSAVVRASERRISKGTGEAHVRVPRAKNVIAYAMEEARSLNHEYVGTEHILLGLLREEEACAAAVLAGLGVELVAVRTEILAILQRASEDGADNPFSPQTRIPWLSTHTTIDDDTKRRVRQLAEEIAPLQKAKEEAVARRQFAEAAAARDKADRIWRELRGFKLPLWVWRNVERLACARPITHSRFPVLDMLGDESGEPDARIVSLLPQPLMPPVRFVLETVSPFPVSTLKAAMALDDIGSPFFQGLVPLISPQSVARRKSTQEAMLHAAFSEISRAVRNADAYFFRPVLLCVAQPTELSEEAREEVYAGLHRTQCDFVIFEAGGNASAVLARLPEGTRLLGEGGKESG